MDSPRHAEPVARRKSTPAPDDLILLPGIRLLDGGDGLLVVVAGDRAVTVRDTPTVRRLVDALAHGSTATPEDAAGRRALTTLVDAGLTEPRAATQRRAAGRAAARVLVDAPDRHAAPAIGLLLASGVAVTTRRERATGVLLVGDGEVDRRRVAEWVQRDVAHLLVAVHGRLARIGPFVQPGVTSCLHCLDAHRRHRDPSHPALLDRVGRVAPMVRGDDPAVSATAIGWAVRDVVTAVEGGRPSTWSATVTLEVSGDVGLSAQRQEWRRHPDCGCAWADLVSPRVG